MDSETEVIRQQMEGTRTALSDKLGKLEEQLDQKVHQTAESVAETVELPAASVTTTCRSYRPSVSPFVSQRAGVVCQSDWPAADHW